ncbi:MAG: hypothetical protein IT577_21600 [Verrucomicrobiae bacterium]|nr:hypothetical protein [Verrucomicrobiae bacterium]
MSDNECGKGSSGFDRLLAKVCAQCPVCRTARARGRGLAYWLVSRVERGICPFCAAYERVTGRKAHGGPGRD